MNYRSRERRRGRGPNGPRLDEIRREREMQQYDDRLMAEKSPLLIKDDAEFGQFEQHLEQARDIGVEAISVDVWWGVAQPTRTTTNFDYYDRVFRAIEERGL